MLPKLEKELKSFQNIWYGGFHNNIKDDPRELYRLKEHCLDTHITAETTVLEIGCGRGAWTKHMLQAKKIYCLDALSADHNDFWPNVGYDKKIIYHQVCDFSCKDIPDNSIDMLFSYDAFCHISYTGMREYMKNLYSKLKKGAKCFVMVADLEKYRKFGVPGSSETEIADYDGEPAPGRWYWYGLDRFCQTLKDLGYIVLQRDINATKRDPVTFFIRN